MSGGCTGRLLNERLTDMAYLQRPAVNKALACFMRSHIHSQEVQADIAESSHKFRHAPIFRAWNLHANFRRAGFWVRRDEMYV